MNNKQKTNIPKQIRSTLSARFERKELLLGAAGNVPKIFNGAEIDVLHTRKGIWKKYIQHDYKSPIFIDQEKEDKHGRFCAVYSQEKRPLTIIRGNIEGKENIDNLLKVVSKKIIEQIPIISIPKKSLTEENGLTFGLRIGLIIAIFFSIFILFDYWLIPTYPKAFLQGANITIGEDVNHFSKNSKIFQYSSITKRTVERLIPVKYRHLITSMYSLVAIFILPVFFFGIVYEVAGKRADMRRVKGFPKEALNFEYGFDAVASINKENEFVKTESMKQELYSRLSIHGLAIDKEEFEKIFSETIIDQE